MSRRRQAAPQRRHFKITVTRTQRAVIRLRAWDLPAALVIAEAEARVTQGAWDCLDVALTDAKEV